MKRYRPMQFDFDTRASMIDLEIQDDWDEDIKEQWRQSKRQVEEWISVEYGSQHLDQKVRNLAELGNAPFSVLAFHNRFFRECRDAFISGSYYPALIGVAALGERVLNHLLLLFREDFRSSAHYKNIYRSESVDDWPKAITILEDWGILIPEVAQSYRQLARIRNDAVHFRPDLDEDARTPALEALRMMNEILDRQFGILGNQPWWFTIPGESFLKKHSEQLVFVQRLVLPRCYLVGPRHRLEWQGEGFRVVDEDYPDTEISDEEFARLREEFLGRTAGSDEANGV